MNDNILKNIKYIQTQYDKAQELSMKGVVDSNLYSKCIQESLEIISLCDKLNPFEFQRYSNDLINIYYINAELLARSVGLYTPREPFTTQEKNVLYTSIARLQKIFTVDPLFPKAVELFKIVILLISMFNSDPKENVTLISSLLMIDPCDYQVQFNLGFSYYRSNDLDNSLKHFKLCYGILNLTPINDTNKEIITQFKVKCLNYIGVIYYGIQDRHLSKYYLYKALELLPNDPDVHNQIGVVFTELRITDKAIEHYKKSIKHYKESHISTDSSMLLASVNMNMGLAYCYEINYVKSIECYNNALKHKPTLSLAYQNKLLDLHYISNMLEDPMYIAKSHKDINKFYPNMIKDYKKSIPDYIIKNPVKDKLKIGFVSGDFIYHPVSYFLHCILKYINYDKFDIYCYSMKIISIKSTFPNINWILCKGFSDTQLRDQIISDKIDILFDLASQTGDNRLDTFVLKPAPIQISYCGYPNTSGLLNMDYHITDRIADSDGKTPGPDNIVRQSTQKYYTEKLLFTKNCFLSYTPALELSGLPPLDIQPCVKNNYLTIGTFNRYNKINNKLVYLWERILKECPNVRFIIKNKEFLTPSLKTQFEKTWKDPEIFKRVIMIPYSDTYTDHLPDYNKMDISVDTNPYSGTTTSCESLAMGVPVVTLFDSVRQYHHQNVTSSLMYYSDLKEYIVTSEDQFVEKIKWLSNNLDKLTDLKKTVKNKFINNICNYQKFVKDFEETLLETYTNHFS